jgi:hypothetical protein
MDWFGIVAAGLAALAAGGAAFFASFAMKGPAWLTALRAGLVLLAAAAGGAGGLMLFDAAGGRNLSAPSLVESEMAAELFSHTYVRRVFEDFPEREADIRARAEAAFQVGGASSVKQIVTDAATETGAFAVQYYAPRAQDRDLIRFITEIVRIFRHLEKTDPMRCYRFATGKPSGNQADDSLDALGRVIGDERIAAYQAAVDEMTTRAFQQPVKYDVPRAEAIVTAVGQEIIARDGIESLALLSGNRDVTSDVDAKRACRAAGDMYERITRHPAAEAAGALRHVLRDATVPATEP